MLRLELEFAPIRIGIPGGLRLGNDLLDPVGAADVAGVDPYGRNSRIDRLEGEVALKWMSAITGSE